MWILEQEHLGEHRYILYDRTKYIIGRISSNIVLPNDSSVSRQHAVIHVIGEKLFLEDNNSKYGTFYYANISSCVRLKSGERKEIRAGDRVRFGMLKNKWIISQVNYHVLCSTLSVQQMNLLQTQLKSLGGNIENQAQPNCTHLTMPKLSMTPKLLYALIKNIPIVNCDFWTQILLAIKERKHLPQEQDFRPLNALKVNLDSKRANRQQLFENRIFIFMETQICATYKPIVEAGGGQVGVLEENYKQQVLQPNVIVIEFISTTNTQSSQLYNEVSCFLQENGQRSIPEFEIAMAVIECNMRKWCNTASEASEVPETNEEEETMDSMESLSSIRVSESPIESSQSSQLQKRKHESIFESDSEDEDELVALTKRSCINKQIPQQRPVTPPPLTQEPAPVFVSAFRAHAPASQSAESSQERVLREQAEDSARARNRAESRAKAEARAAARAQAEQDINVSQVQKSHKRTRIAVLGNDDEEDADNLFEFSCTHEKRTKRQQHHPQQIQHQESNNNAVGSGSGSGASDDELFKKPKPKPKEPMPEVESLFEFDLLAKSKLRKERVTHEANSHIELDVERPCTSRAALAHCGAKNLAVLTPMKLPQRMTTDGWLQKGKTSAELKLEPGIMSEDIDEGMLTLPLDLSKTRIAVTAVVNDTTANAIYTNTKVFRKCQPTATGGERQMFPTKMQEL